MVHLGVVPWRHPLAPLVVEVVVGPVRAAPARHLIGPSPVLVEVEEQIGDARAHADGGEEPRPRADEGDPFAAVAVPVDADPFRIDVAHLDHFPGGGLDALEHVAVRRAGAEVDVRQHRDVALAHGLERDRPHA